METEQTYEELEAHYGPDGPVQAAQRWLDAVLTRDVEAIWHGLHPDFQEAMVRGVFRVAERYVPLVLEAEWWKPDGVWPAGFWTEGMWLPLRNAIGDDYSPSWVADSQPRIVAPDVEEVLFGPGPGELAGIGVTLALVGGEWRVTHLESIGVPEGDR